MNFLLTLRFFFLRSFVKRSNIRRGDSFRPNLDKIRVNSFLDIVTRSASLARFFFFFLAKKYGYRIDQVPVRWIKYVSDRLNPWRDPLFMLRDTLKVRLYDILGKYDQV